MSETSVINLTPTRKRKRNAPAIEKCEIPAISCFTNAAFSSTPKKIAARRRKDNNSPIIKKESITPPSSVFIRNSCLEIKSLEELLHDGQQEKEEITSPKNPYEVVRKPPKKKKRENDIEVACFVNPALNLEMPDKQFNPFEVVRDTVEPVPSIKSQCFINEALNLRGQNESATRNPYEIKRASEISTLAANPNGVENLALQELPIAPTTLKLGIPFKPTLGCRIDFGKLPPLTELTPSKLLAEKLIFSPVLPPPSKRSLCSIKEESPMDIGKELDRYQLELENSINEAKLLKNCGEIPHQTNGRNTTFTQKLTEITEVTLNEEDVDVCDDGVATNGGQTFTINVTEIKETSKLELLKNEMNNSQRYELETETTIKKVEPELEHKIAEYSIEGTKNDINEAEHDDNDDEDDDKDLDDDLDFKAPAPFVRSYRPAAVITTKEINLKSSKESLHSIKSNDKKPCSPSSSSASSGSSSSNVKLLIRKSIRKLIHPTKFQNKTSDNSSDENQEPKKQSKPERQQQNFLTTLRHSLRQRKTAIKQQQQQPLVVDNSLHQQLTPTKIELSIIDTSESRIKLKSFQPTTEYIKVEDLSGENPNTIRNSLRRSTRGLRRQFMKTILHKDHEEYALSKCQ